MIRILVVDDDPEKRRRIAVVLYSAGIQLSIDSQGDVTSAKRALKGTGYDLLILDINLPKRMELGPVPDGGVELLRWLRGRGASNRPPYIVGLTEYEKSFKLASHDFKNFIWSVVKFSHSDADWQTKLVDTLQIIADQTKPPYPSDGKTYKTDVGIVTALQEPELSAVLATDANWALVPVRHDATSYYSGVVSVGTTQVSMIAAAASDKGLTGAAVAATKLIYSFRPRILFIVGICAGLRKRTKIGDVLVGDPVWDWGSGKVKKDKKGRESFHPAQYQLRVDETLRNHAKKLESDVAWTDSVFRGLDLVKPKQAFRVRVGPIASGASVLQNSSAVDRILADHKDLLGIEMEIFSVLFSAHVAPQPRPLAMAIKSVCDYGDGKKNNRYQKYAAATSVATMQRLIEDLAPMLVADRPR